MIYNCSYSELLDINSEQLKPHPKNPNKHPGEQIKRLAEIISYQGQRAPIVISKLTGYITKGHGRLLAIKHLGWDKVAVDYQEYADEVQEWLDIVADNTIASWSEMDLNLAFNELDALLEENNTLIDADLLGIKIPEASEIPAQSEETKPEIYTRKIVSPIYTPTGEKPEVNDIYDMSYTKSLIDNINSKSLPDDIKEFLTAAAFRHTKFNYKFIAELYAHVDADVKKLMEDSALVVIDFDRAIELGFVKLSEGVMNAYRQENQ